MFYQYLSVDEYNIFWVDHPFNIKQIKYVSVYYTKSFFPRYSRCKTTFKIVNMQMLQIINLQTSLSQISKILFQLWM